MDKLPEWVVNFNKSDKVKSYLKTWNTVQDIKTYTESGSDENDFEGGFLGKDKRNISLRFKKVKC